jgi:hypothetical protein
MVTARAVYAALIGDYEELREQPAAETSTVPFICFTDDPDLRSETWDVRLVEPLLAMDPIRSARALKLSGHIDLAAYDETLYIDARVTLAADPATILDSWLDGADVAAPRHSFRADVVSEFEMVLLAGLDESSRLYEQLTHYAVTDPERLQGPVPWTGILARRHTPAVETGMREWLLHVTRYSRRDQLSFMHALALAAVTPRLVDLDNHVSDVHQWHEPRGRSARPSVFRVADSLQPPIAEVGELRLQIADITRDMQAAVAARDARITELDQEVALLRRRNLKKRRTLVALRRALQARSG